MAVALGFRESALHGFLIAANCGFVVGLVLLLKVLFTKGFAQVSCLTALHFLLTGVVALAIRSWGIAFTCSLHMPIYLLLRVPTMWVFRHDMAANGWISMCIRFKRVHRMKNKRGVGRGVAGHEQKCLCLESDTNRHLLQ